MFWIKIIHPPLTSVLALPKLSRTKGCETNKLEIKPHFAD